MRSPSRLAATAVVASSSVVYAVSLSDLCTTSVATAALPAADFLPGITIDTASVEVSLMTNSSFSSDWYPATSIDYCNITLAYSHNGIANDIVHVEYWVPAPENFKNRYVSTGGGGLAINSGSQYLPSGVIVGAVAGATDGGFGSFNTDWDAVFLLANGTINWQSVYMFGYQAHNELATLGKEFTANLFNMTTKVYSYYQGCSEGGREGWSQAQRFADQFDGVVAGAPAFRYGQQQVNHLVANVVQETQNYFPPPCELQKIVNLTIAACDPLDGLTDGVISRSDLCMLNFDVNSTLGESYYCAASDASAGAGGFSSLGRRQFFGGGSATPEQSGTVSVEGISFVNTYLAGLRDSAGRRAYITYQIGSDITLDAATTFDNTTNSWGVSISSLGGEWVARFLELQDISNLASLNNVTYDTLKDWMIFGQNKYTDSLQTTYPDLGSFRDAGSKIIHLHGEQDNSIPTGSSVHYYESVRSIMYPNSTFNESTTSIDEFYRLFLVPGGAHCGTNTDQANGVWPQTTLQTLIAWVENGVAPDTLNGTGTTADICRWPTRPLWSDNGSSFSCVYDQASIDTWIYDFNAYSMPLY